MICGTKADYRTLREDELVSIYLTCTVDPISTVTWVAKTGETPFCVSTLCICMTVVQIRALTLINICTTTKLSIKGGPCNLSLWKKYCWSVILLTTAVQAILIQQVSLMTAAGGASNGVSTIVFTSSICSITFIDVCDATSYSCTMAS